MSDHSTKPWLDGGAVSQAEIRAAQLLRKAQALELEALEQVQRGRLSARLAQRLHEGEWPSTRPHAARWWLGALVATSVALALIFFVTSSRDAGGGSVVSGEVLARDDHGERWLFAGQTFATGQTLSAARGDATLRLHARGMMKLTANSTVQMTAPSQVTVVSGEMKLKVEKRDAKEPAFTARADDVTVTVVGTQFRVAVTAATGVVVNVTEGRVRVDSKSGSVLLDPSLGEWRSRPQGDPQFDAAARLAQAGRLHEAKELYVKLAQNNDPSAETALYLHARLEAREFHKLERALEVLAEMERRFPTGPLSRERLQSQLEALVALQRCDSARAVLRELGHLFPTEEIDEGSLGSCRQ